MEDYTLVMDRGFFSKGNIEELLHEKIPFIMPATMTLKSVKELMSSAQKDIESPQYLNKLNKKPIFVKPVVLERHCTKLLTCPQIIQISRQQITP